MRVLFLTISGRNGASSRYRVYQFLPELERRGHEAVVMPQADAGRGIARPLKRYMEHREVLRAAQSADVVVIQKRLFDADVVKGIKNSSGGRLVFDFDDSIFTSPAGDWSPSTRRRVDGRLRAVIGAADVVIAGNGFLGDKARELGAKTVEVIPTSVDLSGYIVKKHADGPVTLGWIGSSVNHRYLDMLADVLQGLSKRHVGLRLLVVSDRDFFMDGVEVVNRRWSEQTEVNDLFDMDIGLMPLEDNEWTRGKCALKALQYMAAGIPPVCSAVGANLDVVEDGRDGYLCGDDACWTESIEKLIGDAGLRERMGAEARRKVEGSYSLERAAERLVKCIEGNI